MNWFKLSIAPFLLCLCPLAQGQGNGDDSVIVVKGQVSDYYITVSKKRILEGIVSDPDGRPLEGATVMFTVWSKIVKQ